MKTSFAFRRIIPAVLAALLLTCLPALGEGAPVSIVFSDKGVECADPRVLVNGSTVTISAEGVYEVSGACAEGQILVTTPKKTEVELVLNGLSLKCAAGPVVWANTDHLTLTLAPGSQNDLGDGEDRTLPSSEKIPKAAVYASDDLTLQGTGSLTVTSLIGNAVHCKDDLTLREATLTLDAENDGLRGNDAVSVESGNVTIRAKGDGIQSSNTDSGKGHVTIEGGTLDIVADKDGIQAAGVLQINGGSLTIRAGMGK